MNTTEFKRMLIDNCNLKPGGHNVWWRAKTCPFCGEKAEMIYVSKYNFYTVQCSSPKCRINPSTDPNQSRAVVIRAWNKRAY